MILQKEIVFFEIIIDYSEKKSRVKKKELKLTLFD